MKITHGISTTYHKRFLLSEDGLKEFHNVMENAVKRFPAPAELIYTVYTDDSRYFETRRFKDVTHDIEVQRRAIAQIVMEADFIDQPDRVHEGVIEKGSRENWNIRVMFTLSQSNFGDFSNDKIRLRVQSEDRKWANDYINRLESLIYRLPVGNSTPNIILWLFAVPLFIFLYGYFTNDLLADWLKKDALPRYAFYALTFISALMTLTAALASTNKPPLLRLFLGPLSAFTWGEAKYEQESLESFRQSVMYVLGVVFLIVLTASMYFAM